MEANYGKTCSTGSKRAGNIATGNEALVRRNIDQITL